MLIFTLMKQKKQIIIFTDLDGSLLNKDTFRFDEIEDYFTPEVLQALDETAQKEFSYGQG